MSTLPPIASQGVLPQTTIIPNDDKLFNPYFSRTYEALAQTINAKDGTYFTIPIRSTAANIPNVANFGSFLMAISGQSYAKDGSWPPCLTIALCKASDAVSGVVTPITSQAGQGGVGTTWVGATLTVTSTATNFQIAHSVSGVTGNFNIRIIGTQ